MNRSITMQGMGAAEIIRSIENLLSCAGPYGAWTIGLAADIEQARTERDEPGLWTEWQAGTAQDARRILDHFVQRGMMIDPATDPAGAFIYIF